MLQISNQRYDYVKEQLTQSFKQTHYGNKPQTFKTSYFQQESCDNANDENITNSVCHNNTVIYQSQRSFNPKQRKLVARIMESFIGGPQKENDEYINRRLEIIIIQKYLRRFLCMRRFKKKCKSAKFRRHVLVELYESETHYISDLEVIVNYLIANIRVYKLLNEDDILKLFLNIEQVLTLNNQFHQELQKIKENYTHNMKISMHLRKFIPFFKIYYDYCSRFQLEQVSELRLQNNGLLDDFITKIEEDGDKFKGLNLESFLVRPVQQLPRYVLLFRQLLKGTEPDHPDYQGIKEILDGFISINVKMDIMMNTTKQNLKLISQYGTIDPQEIEIIKKKRQEELEIICALQKNIHIKVIGTQKYKDGISAFTIYMIEFAISNYRFKSFQRFSNLLKLQNTIIARYPNVVTQRLDTSVWYNVFSSAVIKQRSEQIEQLLLSLFQHSELRHYEDLLIQYLDLPDNFFYINMSTEVRVTDMDDVIERDSYEHMKGTQIIKISRSTYNFTRNSLQTQQFFPLEIILGDQSKLIVEITKQCRCYDLIETIAKSIHLQQFIDFKIVISCDDSVRLLDDNEVVYRTMRNYNNGRKGLCKMLNKIADMFQSSQPQFYFIKCIYLSNMQEISDYTSDSIRLRLLTQQALQEIQTNTLNLNRVDYEKYAAYYIYIKHHEISRVRLYQPQEIHSMNSIPVQLIKQIIPVDIFRQMELNQWKSKIFTHLHQIHLDVKSYEDSYVSPQSETQYASMLFLRMISCNSLYGVKLFKIRTITTEQSQQLKLPAQYLFGVSHKSVQFLNATKKQLYTYQLVDLLELQYNGENRVTLRINKLSELIMECGQAYDLQRIVEEYKQIQLIQASIARNESFEFQQLPANNLY